MIIRLCKQTTSFELKLRLVFNFLVNGFRLLYLPGTVEVAQVFRLLHQIRHVIMKYRLLCDPVDNSPCCLTKLINKNGT